MKELAIRLIEEANISQEERDVLIEKFNRELSNIEYSVYKLLNYIGMPANIKGYHYIKKAILLSYEDADMLENITKVLYPTIAKEFKTTSSRVERAMRHAIEVVYDDATSAIYQILQVSSKKGKATNSEFVAGMVEYLKYEGIS